MTRYLIGTILGSALLTSTATAVQAERPYDRVALMLIGSDCAAVLPQIVTDLTRQSGVQRVDPDLVPDHLMIDHVSQQLSESDLVTIANTAIAGGVQCHAEVMKSCITAGPMSHPELPAP